MSVWMGRVILWKCSPNKSIAAETLNNVVDRWPVTISQLLSPAIVCLVQWAHVYSDSCIKDGGCTRGECIDLSSPELIWLLHCWEPDLPPGNVNTIQEIVPFSEINHLPGGQVDFYTLCFYYGVGNNFFSLNPLFALDMGSFIVMVLPEQLYLDLMNTL